MGPRPKFPGEDCNTPSPACGRQKHGVFPVPMWEGRQGQTPEPSQQEAFPPCPARPPAPTSPAPPPGGNPPLTPDPQRGLHGARPTCLSLPSIHDHPCPASSLPDRRSFPLWTEVAPPPREGATVPAPKVTKVKTPARRPGTGRGAHRAGRSAGRRARTREPHRAGGLRPRALGTPCCHSGTPGGKRGGRCPHVPGGPPHSERSPPSGA